MPPLHRSALADDPIDQFRDWYERAAEEVPLVDAMTIATVDAAGAPNARMVLLKGFGPDGFRFFTNLGSAKARELEATGRAALVLYWRELDRQVRIRGEVEKLPKADDDAYFATRPTEARIGAWASPQSDPLPDRDTLDGLVAEATDRFAGSEVPRPESWGGYLVRPDRIEFWQGQHARLHDRFVYIREADGWTIQRLAP
jgi:pyridoxamine 5'-phosphate oxidase